MGHLQWSITRYDRALLHANTLSMDLAPLQPLLRRTLVIVAHPDDETISCGGLLQRMQQPCVVFATDGAPEDDYFWKKYGSRKNYAALREQEARAALKQVGVEEVEFLSEQSESALVDQRLYASLPAAFSALSTIVEKWRPDCILTLAYEGGHPDHDSVSFLSAQLGRRYSLPVWEAPLYHRSPNGDGMYQRFVEEHWEVVEYEVKGKELEAKKQMLKCYKSQFDALPSFNVQLERFRPQVAYDYSRRPHEGKLNYEVWQWRMSPEEVCAAFVDFSAAGAATER